MPGPQKPRGRSPAKQAANVPLPDGNAMAAYVAEVAADERKKALEQAQEIMWDAWDHAVRRSRIALAHKALRITPICADAFNVLASEVGAATQARDLYRLGVLAGELALGPKGFEDFAGRFWGFIETRPYMRAMHGLAISLIKLGEEEEAIGLFRQMLKLNPGDNQGIRYLLLGSLLKRDDISAAKAVLADYGDEASVYWAYSHLLIAYREGKGAQPATRKRLKQALKCNAHAPALLTGEARPVFSDSGFAAVGGPEEASDYLLSFGEAWRKTPGAVEWLRAAVASLSQPKRRPDKTLH